MARATSTAPTSPSRCAEAGRTALLAVALLPFALTAVMIVVDRVMASRHPERLRAKPLALLGLAAVGVLSHPFLDWLNNYGVRLLMPFSERWFYGDTLFIVDPWLWLILGGAVMLAWTTHTRGRVTAAALGVGTTALMLLAPWCRSGRARSGWPGSRSGRWPGPASATRAGRASRWAPSPSLVSTSPRCSPDRGSPSGRCANWPLERGWAAEQVAAMPVPAEPLRRSVIVVTRGPLPVRACHLD